MDITSRIGIFFGEYPEVNYPKGAVVINEDDTNDQVYFMEKGVVKEYYISSTGDLFIVHIYNSGTFFPMSVLGQNLPNTNYFEALTPCTVRIAPASAFSDFVTSDHDLLKDVTQRLLGNLVHMTRRLGVIASGNAYQRTASTLAYLGKVLGKKTGGNGTIIIDEPILSHKEIAGWIGTARETTSIQMKLLERKGLISYSNRKILIHDLPGLILEGGLS